MDDFKNEFNNDLNNEQKNDNQTQPTAPQQENGGNSTYYTPSQSEKTEPEPKPQENTTYHYSYTNGSSANNPDPNSQGYAQQDYTSASGSAYNQNQNANQNQNYYSPNQSYQNQQQGGYNPNQGNAYSQTQNSGYTQTETVQPDSNGDKPKKSSVGKVILIVVIVCVVVAVIGLLAGQLGSSSSDTDSDTQTTQESDVNDVETQDSDEVATVDSDGNYTVAGVAEKCMDSCVGVSVYTQQSSSYSYFYNYGTEDSGDDSDSTESGEGSGVIMSEQNGLTYILTCAHVINDGDSFVVTLNDGTEYDATMVAYDSQTDIGVLSIEATGLQVAEFADSDNLVVGEQVVAIGCPGGLEFMNSVTSGYISALDRPISSSIGYDTYCIQTDAAINPGNSGGALFNMQGQVIGINSSKIASTDYEGMGFAIPSSTAVSTANSLIKSGYVEGRAKIGIRYTTLTSYNNSSSIISALEQLGFEDAEGTMIISSVDDNSDLKNKDIQEYDMIVAVNGETMTSTDIMTSILADSAPGDTITLTIARIENNQINIFEVECTLIESTGDN